jgi:hypothetical protein
VYPTPYLEANLLLSALRPGVQDVLGEKLVGLYLYGSATTGDFDAGVSDIDLLAAISTELADAEFEALRQMHDDVVCKHIGWDDRVEVQYVPTDGLASFRDRTSSIAVISPGEPLNRKDAGSDWLMNWYLVREYGVTLIGPEPAAIIPPINRNEFVQAVRDYAVWQVQNSDRIRGAKSQSYAVLTGCRALYTVTHHEHVSKQEAALWACQEMPEWAPLIRQALLWREGASGVRQPVADPEASLHDTLRFIHLMADRASKI